MGAGAEFLDNDGLENHIKTRMSSRSTVNADAMSVGRVGRTGATSHNDSSTLKKGSKGVKVAGKNPYS